MVALYSKMGNTLAVREWNHGYLNEKNNVLSHFKFFKLQRFIKIKYIRYRAMQLNGLLKVDVCNLRDITV